MDNALAEEYVRVLPGSSRLTANQVYPAARAEHGASEKTRFTVTGCSQSEAPDGDGEAFP